MATFRVRVRDGEKELEIEGDRKYIDQMLKRFGYLGGTANPEIGAKASAATPALAAGKEKNSPAEFILQLQLKKHSQIALAFGFYLEKFKGMAKFTPGDINNCYYEAKMEPSNTSLTIMQNIKRGLLMAAKGSTKDSGGKRYYTLTQSGMHLVEKGFKKAK